MKSSNAEYVLMKWVHFCFGKLQKLLTATPWPDSDFAKVWKQVWFSNAVWQSSKHLVWSLSALLVVLFSQQQRGSVEWNAVMSSHYTDWQITMPWNCSRKPCFIEMENNWSIFCMMCIFYILWTVFCDWNSPMRNSVRLFFFAEYFSWNLTSKCSRCSISSALMQASKVLVKH